MTIVTNFIYFHGRYMHFSIYFWLCYTNILTYLATRKTKVCFSILYILSYMNEQLNNPTPTFKEPNLVDTI